MNLFQLCFNMTHIGSSRNWVESTATFTGKYNIVSKSSKYGLQEPAHYEFEIEYFTADGKQRGWHQFYPIKDPAPEEITGMQMRIEYNKRKPYLFRKSDVD